MTNQRKLITVGKAWVYGDNIDTDVLAPGPYLLLPVEELATHCLEAVDRDFASQVESGDVLVGGDAFGLGSSREQAVEALKHLGIRTIVAKSFARIFYRNALNLGLPALNCPDTSRIHKGDRLEVDPVAGCIKNLTTGETLTCESLPPYLISMIEDGGLIAHLKKKLRSGGDRADVSRTRP